MLFLEHKTGHLANWEDALTREEFLEKTNNLQAVQLRKLRKENHSLANWAYFGQAILFVAGLFLVLWIVHHVIQGSESWLM